MDYRKDFDPKDYLSRYYVSGCCGNFFIDEQIKAMYHPDLRVGSGSLIDIGVGPTVHTALISSKKFSNIVVSDYVESNRNEVNKWLENHPQAHDWSSMIDYIAAKESEDAADIVKRTRAAVKECVPVDVHDKNNVLGSKNSADQFDCLLSSMCLTSACLDLKSFQNAIANLNKLVKEGGFFILMDILRETYYTMNDKRIPVLYLTENDMVQTLIANGHRIVYLNSQEYTDSSDMYDCKGCLFVISQKLQN